ncbi:hypothetical protein PF005_g22603 [Phytophthora fragariae]|uniref:Uncharacterized protein n=1 Tax=Phytophthora fragariae TaxID=53985 RepID=A0A6A3E2F5_9STRA|nr:hypothetical protein PF003_g32827 [Phytophthora fragariae]KAE8926427.1 hypothetical protein PF009_g23383 [Phytophthora fragariae]KAE8983341.1 hypothetical protein PF011_g21229 [Phytophthora fragariae]KAE9081416.1 hypothetical protein PF007_g22667 [Phytophthora fragariae]KAE9081442.1 hypothetical protein PF010_g21993 [Phytophthora fragariae]
MKMGACGASTRGPHTIAALVCIHSLSQARTPKLTCAVARAFHESRMRFHVLALQHSAGTGTCIEGSFSQASKSASSSLRL